MQQDQARSVEILGKMPGLKAGVGDFDVKMLTIIENNARKRQRETASSIQLELELKVASLKAKIQYLEEKMKKSDAAR